MAPLLIFSDTWQVFPSGLLLFSVTHLCLPLRNPTDCSPPGFPVLHHLCYYKGSNSWKFRPSNPVTISSMGFRITVKKRERSEIKQKHHKDGLEFLCEHSSVCSGPEPKSTNPNPLNHKQLLFAHLAKMVQTHFVEDDHSQQFLTFDYRVYPITLHMALANIRLYLSRGKEFQRWCFL